MKTEDFSIGGTVIPKGSRVDVKIELPKMYNTPTHLTVTVIRGKKDGPTMFVSAAIHGDELNGIEIIRRLRKLEQLKRIRGTLILIPVVNVYGIINRSRYLPDRRDLNRCFPGSKSGSLAGRMAHIFFNEIVLKSDLGIDLHTGAIHRSNMPHVRMDVSNEESLFLAKTFAAPVIVNSTLRDGSLRSEAREHGIPVLLFEAGEALRFDEKCIRIGVNGIVNILRAKEMLPKRAKTSNKKTPVLTMSSKWIRSNEGGMIRTIKALGETVEKGDIIGYIDEPLGENSHEVKALSRGVVIGKTEIPLIHEGDAIYHIASFDDLAEAEEKIEFLNEDSLDFSNSLNGLDHDDIV